MDLAKQSEEWFGDVSWLQLAGIALGVFVLLIALDRGVVGKVDRSEIGRLASRDGSLPVVKRWRRYDPRGFVNADELSLPDDRFDLAWIVGSSITIKDAAPQHRFRGRKEYELSEVLVSQVSHINEAPLWLHEYMIPALRIGDVRRGVIHAAFDSEIDAIMVELNPAWLFNDWLVYSKSNQRGSVVGVKGSRFGDFVQALKFARVSDMLAAYTDGFFSFVRDRDVISKNLPVSKNLPFPLLSRPAAKRKLRYLDLNKFYPGQSFAAPPATKKHEGYRGILLKQTLSERGQAAKFFRLNLKTLAESGKPALLYIPPLPIEMREDTEVVAFMGAFVELVEQMAGRYGAENIHVVTHGALATRPPFIHKDIIHLKYGQGPLDEIKELLDSELGLALKYVEDPDDYRGAP